MDVSIIICTRNRAESLEKTLDSLKNVEAREGLKVELLVVDNGSTDHTRKLVESRSFPQMECRYLWEPSAGVAKARNQGLASAKGQVILFTDDDVAPAETWLEFLSRPLLERKCDGVVGKIELARNLSRPWMGAMHRLWLAAPVELCGGVPDLIGASMGIHRHVLDCVPVFDTQLGPGALGFEDDTLFSWQMREAGLKILHVPQAVVTHSPAVSRLLRSSWLAAARARGRAEAYLLHHWKHGRIKCPALRARYLAAKLSLRRLAQAPPLMNQEGSPAWEISYEYELAACRQFLTEQKKQRAYRRRAARKTTP